jgi:hypothetical protein
MVQQSKNGCLKKSIDFSNIFAILSRMWGQNHSLEVYNSIFNILGYPENFLDVHG